MERAVHNNLMLGEPALGIEQCECPEQYSGLSCQVNYENLVNPLPHRDTFANRADPDQLPDHDILCLRMEI